MPPGNSPITTCLSVALVTVEPVPYHGKYSFDTFTHMKAIMKTAVWFDPAVKYPPLKGKLKLLKWLVG